MGVIKAVNSRASIGRAIRYVTKDEKTEEKLITGKDCDPFHAIEDMKATKELWGKTGGREYKHYVQSFAEGENITPELAHKIAKEWAEKEFKGYECLIATHTDKGHIHSHVIVNSVNFETGEKFRQSRKWLERAKGNSDRICAKYGLSITEKGKSFDGKPREDMVAYSKDKYNLLEKADQGKAKSYVYDTALAVMDSKEQATSREEFIRLMKEKGYKTTWEDSKKHITFENQEGQKVRASNLEKTFRVPFGKEHLEHEFETNARRKDIREQSGDYPGTSHPGNVGHPLSEVEPVGSRTDENRERTTQADVSGLYEQLQQIRGLDKKYNPKEQRKLDEERKRAEQRAREKTERTSREQHNIEQKHIDRSR